MIDLIEGGKITYVYGPVVGRGSNDMQTVEHSVEAIVPFLQAYNRDVEIVSILVPYMRGTLWIGWRAIWRAQQSPSFCGVRREWLSLEVLGSLADEIPRALHVPPTRVDTADRKA